MKNEIVEFSKITISNINKIDDFIDDYMENIKDITDTASDLVKPIKAFISVYELGKKMKFKSFLKSYAHGLQATLDSERLMEYLSDKKNLNFVYETIQSAVNSKSIICSGILGFYVSQILSDQKKITHIDLIFINALQNLNDFELSISVKIIEEEKELYRNQVIKNNPRFSNDIAYSEYVVQKLKTLQILKEIFGGPGNPVSLGQSFWGTYTLTEISKQFYSLIEKSGFYKNIKEN